MPERSGLAGVARGIDELVQAAARTSAQLRAMAERGPGADGTEWVAELVARCLDRAEGPGLEALRCALRGELGRWQARADRDPSAARVRDVVALLLAVLEPERRGNGDA